MSVDVWFAQPQQAPAALAATAAIIAMSVDAEVQPTNLAYQTSTHLVVE